MNLEVLFEDNHVLVVHKPAGLLSQGDNSGDISLVDLAQTYLKAKYDKPGAVYLALIHRLDRPVGGVMVLGKTSKAAQRLTEQFQQKTTQKTYWAVTERRPSASEGTLSHYLRKIQGKNIIRAYDNEVKGSKLAVLRYRVLAEAGVRCLLEVTPLTGRQHQIRAQLAAMGCPIVGDVKYGKTDFLPDQSIALYARRLNFEHPTGKKRLTFDAPPPDGFPWRLFNPAE